jgi:hypothetical protein
MDKRTVIEARRLAQAACVAAEASVPSEGAYVRLRAWARALNEREQWASRDEFDAQFPTAAALSTIDELERQYRLSGAASPSPDPNPHEQLHRLLLELCGWATGIEAADQARKPPVAD